MIVTGSAKIEMKGPGETAILGPGGFAMMPTKHVHQFTCNSACSAFVSSDTTFDIHYVDASGAEIPPDAALKKKVAALVASALHRQPSRTGGHLVSLSSNGLFCQ